MRINDKGGENICNIRSEWGEFIALRGAGLNSHFVSILHTWPFFFFTLKIIELRIPQEFAVRRTQGAFHTFQEDLSLREPYPHT